MTPQGERSDDVERAWQEWADETPGYDNWASIQDGFEAGYRAALAALPQAGDAPDAPSAEQKVGLWMDPQHVAVAAREAPEIAEQLGKLIDKTLYAPGVGFHSTELRDWLWNNKVGLWRALQALAALPAPPTSSRG